MNPELLSRPLEPGYFAPLGSHSRERSSAAKPCPVFSAPLPLWPAASTRCPRAPSPSRPAAWHVSRPNVLLFPDPRHEHPGLDLSTRPPRSDADLPLRRPPAADPNAPPKVAYPWLDPSNPGNWKEEHVSKPGPRPPPTAPIFRRSSRVSTRVPTRVARADPFPALLFAACVHHPRCLGRCHHGRQVCFLVRWTLPSGPAMVEIAYSL